MYVTAVNAMYLLQHLFILLKKEVTEVLIHDQLAQHHWPQPNYKVYMFYLLNHDHI